MRARRVSVGRRLFGAARLTLDQLPANIRKSEYAVRGEIVAISAQIQKELEGGKAFPFTKLVPCNIGNPQAVGQEPLTYHRQVLSQVVGDGSGAANVPSDVLERGAQFRAAKVGAYSHSKGHPVFRQKVAEYIERRDGPKCPKVDVEDLFLTDGASPAVKVVVELLIHDADDVILIPIPQYPLYSASITRSGGTWVGYELQEDYSEVKSGKAAWGLDAAKLEEVIAEQTKKGKRVRAVAVINPGNPTGNVLSRSDIEDVVKFAAKHNLVLMADEVYQENVYSEGKQFVSFRQVAHEIQSDVQLFSFHSISKGFYGECGLRGGYVHLTNIDAGINDEMYKLMSMNLCSNTVGQAMVASITNPPLKPGEPSYALYKQESDAIFSALKKKAALVYESLNSIPGYNCMPIEGAMYAFPEVKLPAKYIAHCRDELGKEPDTVYCRQILEKLGVVTVPGNGFGQRPGTFHYRLTILPQEDDLKRVLEGLRAFQEELYQTWGEP